MHTDLSDCSGGQGGAVMSAVDAFDGAVIGMAFCTASGQFLQANDVSFWVRLLPSVEVNFVSETITSMLGYTPADFYADPTLRDRVVHPSDLAVIDQLTSDPCASGMAVVRWLRSDGALIWVEHRLTKIFSPDGDVTDLVCVVRDVTEQVTEKNGRRVAQDQAVSNLVTMCTAERDCESAVDEDVTFAQVVARIASRSRAVVESKPQSQVRV
jgi:PAS domain S-box-containing protein